MLLSLTAKLLHVVMLKRPHNLFMAENNSESVDVAPPPHSNTDTPGTVTCLPVAASVVLLLDLECLKLKRASFFRGTHLVTDLKPLAPPTVAEVSSALSRRAKKCAHKNGKKQYL